MNLRRLIASLPVIVLGACAIGNDPRWGDGYQPLTPIHFSPFTYSR